MQVPLRPILLVKIIAMFSKTWPDRGEISGLPVGLDLELDAVKPKLVVALGATAAFALMGRTLVLARERGRLLRWLDGEPDLRRSALRDFPNARRG